MFYEEFKASRLKQESWRCFVRVSPLTISLLITLFPMLALAVAADSGSAAKEAIPEPLPYERRVTLPPLVLLALDQSKAVSFEPKKNRLSFVCLIGTWNRQSDQVHNFFEKNYDFFVERKIGSVAAFSHDTIENLKVWAKKHKPRYLFGLAPTEFVDQLKNPKVPTCWLISRDGQLLRRFELPNETVLSSVYDKLKLWTDF